MLSNNALTGFGTFSDIKNAQSPGINGSHDCLISKKVTKQLNQTHPLTSSLNDIAPKNPKGVND